MVLTSKDGFISLCILRKRQMLIDFGFVILNIIRSFLLFDFFSRNINKELT